jgi:hypothetical protein
MGPYCKFCNNRCFVPTNEGLRASCDDGKIFDSLIDRLKRLEKVNDRNYLKPFYIKRVKSEIDQMKKKWI